MEQEKPQPLFFFVLVSSVLAIVLAVAANYALAAFFARIGTDYRYEWASEYSAKAIGLFIGGFAGGMTFRQLSARKKKWSNTPSGVDESLRRSFLS